MRVSSRAIILKDNKILLMFRRRIKDGVTSEYFAIPGGGLEEGETLDQNVYREVLEELNVKTKILGYLGFVRDEKTEQHFFHCEIVEGEVRLSGEELERMTPENYYEPMWIELSQLSSVNVNNKDLIMNAVNKKYNSRG